MTALTQPGDSWTMGRSALVVLGLSWVVAGCSNQKKANDGIIGITPEYETADKEAPAVQEKGPDADVVYKAAREFTGYRAADDRSFSRESFLTHLAAADAICIGEQHGQALDHYAELAIVEGLLERRAMRGFQLAVGLEMVRSKYQGALDAFSRDALSLERFERNSAWREEWGFPLQYYAPVLEALRDAGGNGLALGVDRALSGAVADRGLAGLTLVETRKLPDLDMAQTEHRELFDSMMEGHPPGNLEQMYEAQVVWDEMMADRSAGFLKSHAPGRKLVVLAGAVHCHRLAIPSRIERRGRFVTVSVMPVVGQPVKGGKDTPEQRLAAGYDYELVFADAPAADEPAADE